MRLFHVKRFTISFGILFIINSCIAQGSIVTTLKPFDLEHVRDTGIVNTLKRFPSYFELSKVEQETIYWLNYVRQKPHDFLYKVLIPFIQQFPEVKGSYIESLIKELKQLSPLQPLKPDPTLITVARAHAIDLGKKGGKISHSSTTGENFQQRMNKFGITECVAENVFEGRDEPVQSVLFLLIDKGVPNLGHRKNILNPNMHAVGVSFHPISGRAGYFFQVQDFSCATQ